MEGPKLDNERPIGGAPSPMVIDGSALIAILTDRPERRALESKIAADPVHLVSAVTRLATSATMIGRHGPNGALRLDQLLTEIGATIVSFDEPQSALARDAFVRFGEGRHPAALDLAACAAYALSVSEAEPLLFSGGGWRMTDVEVQICK
jgi:ribonuclease VapC